MLNYESKADNPVRREGIAIIDVDPESPSFGKWLMDIPLPPDLIAHHIYFNRDGSKAYVTSLGKSATAGLQPGAPHDLAIVITNQHAAVTIDGADAVQGAVTAPDLAKGRVQLGVTSSGGDGSAEVSFANLDARSD